MPQEDDNGQPEATASLLSFFGSRVLRLRTERGWSQQELATKAHATGAMISYVENAKRVPSADLAADLDRAFGTDFFEEFLPFVIRYAYPGWFLPYVELEAQASSIRAFDGQVVSGLLQTEGYARAVAESGRPDRVEPLVAARMTRQAIFEREDRPRAWFILDENALTRPLGGPAVMRAQLARLLEVGEEPRTVIQVLPRTVVSHPGLDGSFTLLSFGQGENPKTGNRRPPHDVLYVDGFSRGRTALDEAEVTYAGHAYDLLRGYALSPQESAGLIRRHMEELAK
ncbi:helix-turn-helix transcriptional regulator [Streptomyces sp. NPDC093085]|uniref:helix-turn-helix domain-containing protein n=1 Tax=Streptomyces sp. NPDC093085 TaxID=3155068 RepID=UPI003424A0C5